MYVTRDEVISRAAAAFKNGTYEEQVEALQELRTLGSIKAFEYTLCDGQEWSTEDNIDVPSTVEEAKALFSSGPSLLAVCGEERYWTFE